MEALPEGWQENELGQKTYNPLEIAKRLVEGQGAAQKNRIQKREAVVEDVTALSARLEAAEDRLATVESKFKTLYEVVETLQERIGD